VVRGRQIRLVATLMIGSALGSCAEGYGRLAGYEVPAPQTAVPAEFPSPYTQIRRSDQPKSETEQERLTRELSEQRAEHVRRAEQEIIARR
jgi:hypothetical protein